jgi:transglutaminase-like putative cysteine protease
MRFFIVHETLYRYSAPVRFAPHVVRLNPRPGSVRIVSEALTATPAPIGRTDVADDYGNLVTRLEFGSGPSMELRIDRRLELETLGAPAPVRPGAIWRPLPWYPDAGDGLDAYRQEPDADDTVRDFARSLAAEAGHDAATFLGVMTRTLHTTIDHHVRSEGAAWPPATTLATRRGACRDIAALFLAACRAMGMAGRFVSGYQAHAQTSDGPRYLHAWAEVSLPGIGWSAWDPTHGIAVTDGHVPLCAAPAQSSTMPVEGGFFGPAETSTLTSTLDCSVRIATD